MSVPNPGSAAAQQQGCRCPVFDNAHGSEAIAKERGGFWVSTGCPVHATQADT